MKTTTMNLYGCSLLEQQDCSLVNGGSEFIKAIGKAIGYVARSFANAIVAQAGVIPITPMGVYVNPSSFHLQ